MVWRWVGDRVDSGHTGCQWMDGHHAMGESSPVLSSLLAHAPCLISPSSLSLLSLPHPQQQHTRLESTDRSTLNLSPIAPFFQYQTDFLYFINRLTWPGKDIK